MNVAEYLEDKYPGSPVWNTPDPSSDDELPKYLNIGSLKALLARVVTSPREYQTTVICVEDLILGAAELLVSTVPAISIDIVAEAVVEKLLDSEQFLETFGRTMTSSYIGMMSHCGYESYPGLAQRSIELSEST